jgi:lysophospholipase L1-like esterase
MKSFYAKHPKLTLLLFNLIVIFLILMAAEFYLKSIAKKPEVVYDNRANVRVSRIREGLPNMSCTVTLDSAHWSRIADNVEFKPHRLRFDHDGFLMPSGVHDNPDREVFFLGGSTTLCQDMDEDSRFPVVSGKRLGGLTGLKVNTYNASLYMNNTLHDINTLVNKVLPYEPDVVVMMETCNDIFMLGAYNSYWEPDSRDLSPMYELPSDPHPVRYFFKELKDFLFPNLFKAAQEALKGKPGEIIFSEEEYVPESYPGDDFFVEKFTKNLKLFINICRAYGITPVLMTQANRMTYPPDPVVSEYIDWITGPAQYEAHLSYRQYMDLQNLFSETIRKVGQEQGVKIIDLDAAVPKTKEYLFDPVHFTEKGSLMVAEIISRELAPLLAGHAGAETRTGHASAGSSVSF